MKHPLGCALVLATISMPTAEAWAQGFPGQPRPGMRPPQQKKPSKPAGPAEAAPEDQEAEEPELPELPSWPGKEKKELELFDLHGYFRFRADLFQNMSLGFQNTSQALTAPFWVPLSEQSSQKCADRVGKPVPGGGDRGLSSDDCPSTTLGGANIRLRLEPTINVAEKVRINAQIDVFDNLVMGSTPYGVYNKSRAPDVPLVAFSESQAPPIVGRNTNKPSILVKRVWGEVDTPVGELRFGRMPWHWGLGILANDGGCWDCNFGDNQDRVMFRTELFKHFFGLGYDFASSGPDTLNVSQGQRYYGGPVIDLEQLDDVDQIFLIAGRRDNPQVIKDKVARGELVVNYGTYVKYRKQDFDFASNTGLNSTQTELANNFIERKAWMVTPDLWAKLLWRKLYLEFEGLMVAGRVENTSDTDTEKPLDILMFGFVLRSQYKFLHDQLKVWLEVGYASGDQNELTDLNRRRLRTLQDTRPGFSDIKLTEFRFDYDYLVDLILFREILGTVANAMYVKPSVQYDLFDSLGGRFDVIYSVAPNPVAYPGNDPNLGVELDLNLYYGNKAEGFYAGLQYGVLFPLPGLYLPSDIYGTASNMVKAEIAQTLQGNMRIKF